MSKKQLAAAAPSVSKIEFDERDDLIGNRSIRFGYLLIFGFLAMVFFWSAYAPISSAALAVGLVGKEGHRKTIQHLEGGIIDQILIKDGDQVKANQELLGLRNIQSRSDFDLLRKQKLIALNKQAGLLAESRNKNKLIQIPASTVELDSVDKAVQIAIEGEIEDFYSRRKHLRDQIKIIAQRELQAREKINALNNEKMALIRRAEIVAKEHEEYQEFELRGLVTRTQVFSLELDKSAIAADLSSNEVSIVSTKQEINNLKMEKSELIGGNAKRISTELRTVRDQLVKLDEQLEKSRDRLERTVIRAPIDGIIVDLKVNTIGGVILPGAPLLDIMPTAGKLIVEAQINPKDRDTVSVGQHAEIRFNAFNQRTTEPVAGKVVFISADRLLDTNFDGNLLSGYRAKIELLEDPSEVLNGASVHPGMQADVMIITGNRTALEYFLKPILKSFNHSFRDD